MVIGLTVISTPNVVVAPLMKFVIFILVGTKSSYSLLNFSNVIKGIMFRVVPPSRDTLSRVFPFICALMYKGLNCFTIFGIVLLNAISTILQTSSSPMESHSISSKKKNSHPSFHFDMDQPKIHQGLAQASNNESPIFFNSCYVGSSWAIIIPSPPSKHMASSLDLTFYFIFSFESSGRKFVSLATLAKIVCFLVLADCPQISKLLGSLKFLLDFQS